MSERMKVLDELARRILAVRVDHPVRVAIDGVDGAGKSTLADELVVPLARSGREIIRSSIDGFHRPRSDRLRRGADSPEGYYLDSFDLAALSAFLLAPLGTGGSRTYRQTAFDFRTDRANVGEERQASSDAILVFDGVFLLRPELEDAWDFTVFLAVGFSETRRRVALRDQRLSGPPEAVLERYERRYIPGQRLYLGAVQPAVRADVVINNNDPAAPLLVPRTSVRANA